jgi:molecular chaperone GrpE
VADPTKVKSSDRRDAFDADAPEREPNGTEPAEELDTEPVASGTAPVEESAAEPEGEGTEAARRYKDRWLRAEADLQNFRRRAQRDVEEARRFVTERALLATIEQLDDLERALAAAREAGATEGWTQGVELVAQRMRDQLVRQGVTEIPAQGAPFDPTVHEALLEVDAPAGVAPGHVVEVARKGYQVQGRALRPARVVVARRTD